MCWDAANRVAAYVRDTFSERGTVTYQVLARKWRPKSFSCLKGQEHVTRALMNALTRQQLHHAYLFTGTRGVGKTTVARILAKALNCAQGIVAQPCGQCQPCQEIDQNRFVDLIEVDAASRTRVEDTRELLENVQYAPTQGRFKIYLIDEVHMLSGHSFNALLKTLEEPPAHVKFILATTDPERIPVTVLSRCLRFTLKALPLAQISEQLQEILQTEKVPFEPSAVQLIAKLAQGSMRDALSLLEQALAYGEQNLCNRSVEAMTGLGYRRYLPDLTMALGQLDVKNVLEIVEKMSELDADFSQVLASLLQILHSVAIMQAIPGAPIGEEFALEGLKELTPEEVQLLYQIALLGQKELNLAPDPRIGFEMTLLRMMLFRPALAKEDKTPLVTKVAPVVEVKALAEVKELDWNEIVDKLALSGLNRVLVKHCIVSKWDGQQLLLTLDPSQQSCLNSQREAQIQQALSQYLNQALRLKIQVQTLAQATPAQQSQALIQARERQAQEGVEQDEVVQDIVSTFDATVEKIVLLD